MTQKYFGDDIDNYILSQKIVATTDKERTDERRLKTFLRLFLGGKTDLGYSCRHFGQNFVPFFYFGKKL